MEAPPTPVVTSWPSSSRALKRKRPEEAEEEDEAADEEDVDPKNLASDADESADSLFRELLRQPERSKCLRTAHPSGYPRESLVAVSPSPSSSCKADQTDPETRATLDALLVEWRRTLPDVSRVRKEGLYSLLDHVAIEASCKKEHEIVQECLGAMLLDFPRQLRQAAFEKSDASAEVTRLIQGMSECFETYAPTSFTGNESQLLKLRHRFYEDLLNLLSTDRRLRCLPRAEKILRPITAKVARLAAAQEADKRKAWERVEAFRAPIDAETVARGTRAKPHLHPADFAMLRAELDPDATPLERVQLFELAFEDRFARRLQPEVGDVAMTIASCVRAGLLWRGSGVLWTILSGVSCVGDISGRCIMIFLRLWREARWYDGTKSSVIPETLEALNVVVGWRGIGEGTSKGIVHCSLQHFRTGGRFALLHELHLDGPLATEEMLECCANFLERAPLHNSCWRLLARILCDETLTAQVAKQCVANVWNEPRLAMWRRLFYDEVGDDLPACVLQDCPDARRGLLLILAALPDKPPDLVRKFVHRWDMQTSKSTSVQVTAGGFVEVVGPSFGCVLARLDAFTSVEAAAQRLDDATHRFLADTDEASEPAPEVAPAAARSSGQQHGRRGNAPTLAASSRANSPAFEPAAPPPKRHRNNDLF